MSARKLDEPVACRGVIDRLARLPCPSLLRNHCIRFDAEAIRPLYVYCSPIVWYLFKVLRYCPACRRANRCNQAERQQKNRRTVVLWQIFQLTGCRA